MPLFLTILEGPSARNATTLLASSDPRLIRLVADELSTRLATERSPRLAMVVEPVKREAGVRDAED